MESSTLSVVREILRVEGAEYQMADADMQIKMLTKAENVGFKIEMRRVDIQCKFELVTV